MNTLKNQQMLLILTLAFVLRLTVFLLFRPWDIQVQTDSVLVDDATGYHRLANCLVDHFSFCGDTFRTPGYPFFMAIFYALFGAKPWLVLFAQIFADLVSVFFVFRIGEMVFSRRVAIIAAIFFAIDPNSIFTSASLLSDSLFVTFLLASLNFYLRGLKQGEGRGFLIAGVLLALAALVRPIAQYYFLILLFFTLPWPTRNLKTRLKWGLVFALAFTVTVSPWLYRNYSLYDKVKLSSVQGEVLLFWQVAYTRGWETNQSREAIAAEFKSQARALGYSEDGNPFANEVIEQQLAVQYIKSHPLIFASRWISGMINTCANLGTYDFAQKLGLTHNLIPTDAFVNASKLELVSIFFRLKSLPEIALGLIVLALLLTNYLTFLLGSCLLIKRQQWSIFALFVVSIMYFIFTGGQMGLARYKLPIEPFYLLIGAYFIDHLLNHRTSRSQTKQMKYQTQ
ncbi:MAG: phospholipid carrier-dependent glycosyltransferase [Methylococcaceae bacterium]|nr:phospholipid carrier-dependent glycosyltransferase [Methylococcaceae bacterium]